MPLSPGTQLGAYRIVAPLGAGGMGEVYRASDTRLGREVALKVLPPHLAGVADSRERFEREAKVISSLSHPNICTLFDIGTQDDVTYLVMELLDGESLAARLDKGPLKIDEVMRLGAQVADALDKAHRKGIVHRDLKPANLMLTKTGVKVLDFGVAKLSEGRFGTTTGTGILPTVAPTRTTPLTMQGAIVGTMQYMAPEQLEGKPVDHRADIFSLGAVLFEMVTGKRAFEGASQASVIAAVLEREPRPVSEITAGTPPSLDRAIGRCLLKDPDERWQSALDIKSELEWIAAQSGTARAAARPAAAGRRRVPAAVTALIAAIGIVVAFLLGWVMNRTAAPPPARLTRTSIVIPPGTSLDTDNASIALSPDGTVLAYAGRERGGPRKLHLRPLDSLTPQALAGTDGATYPFWSPDGRQIGFFADRKLKKVPAAGGAVLTICDAEDGRGASWGADGTIVFSPRPRGGLSMVSAAGGAPTELTTTAEGVFTHRNPHFLPDGKRVLFFSGSNMGDPVNGIDSLDLASRQVARVRAADSEGIPLASGHLIFVSDGNLMAQKLDLASLSLTGEAVPIAENVQFNTFRYTGTYTLSNTGLLLFQSGAIQGDNQLTWYDLDGKKLGTVGDPAIFWFAMDISPDVRRAAVTVRHPDGGGDVWIYDLARGIGSRFTLGENNVNALAPIWSPDGRQVAYIDGAGSLYAKAVDGGTPERKVFTEDSSLVPRDWSPDGSVILYTTQQSVKTGIDLRLVTMTGEPNVTTFLESSANEDNAVFSPDGRWVAYTSDESGRTEVYVQSFPASGGKWQVSASGASWVEWTGTGEEIYFGDLDGKAYAVPVTVSGAGLEIGAPRPLFGGQILPVVGGDFTPDGRRFLGATQLRGEAGPVLTLVTHWYASIQH
jgi:Tol biopolymer transport system component